MTVSWGMPIAFALRSSSLWISSPLTGAPVTGSTQNIRLVVYQRVMPVLATCSAVTPLIGIFFGIGTLVHGMVCSK